MPSVLVLSMAMISATPSLDVGTFDYVATSAYTAALAAVYLGTDPPSEARVHGGSFDRAVRDVMRTGGTGTARASDALQFAMMLYPILVDAVLVEGAIHQDWDNAGRLALIDAESLSLTGLVATSMKNVIGRARPDGRGNTAFPSGHVAVAFAGAGLMCAQHHALHLYRDEDADDAACALGVVAAAATGVLRVMSDRHWATDVIVGAVIGWALGYVMPRWMQPALAPHETRLLLAPNGDGFSLMIAGAF